MPEGLEPTGLSLLPAFVTIALAFATRQVLPALFAGVLSGGLVLAWQTGQWSDANPITSFLLPRIGSSRYAQILLIYLWSLGGLIGVWAKTGAARHFAETVGGLVARSRRSSLGFAWLLGVVFHQGGTVSTVLTASTVKPVADRHRVSHEELSYVVDSTASPIAGLIPFNVWPSYVASLVAGTIPILANEEIAVGFFLASIPFNFYAWFAVSATALLAMGWLPWIGRRMAAARDRSLRDGLLDAPDAEPMLTVDLGGGMDEAGTYRPHLVDFFAPLGVLLALGIGPYLFLGEYWINEAFGSAILTAMGVAAVRGLALREILDGFLRGCQQMTIGAIVLGLAVTLGGVSETLGTGTWVAQTISGQIAPIALPALLTFLCMGIAFATGTSFGTYAVVFPIAMPLAWALAPEPLFIQVCFGAVLGGAMFGDQCSPISDTTILSSMFTGCDLMDHVRTQLPLALAAAALGAVCSTLVAALV